MEEIAAVASVRAGAQVSGGNTYQLIINGDVVSRNPRIKDLINEIVGHQNVMYGGLPVGGAS